MSPRVILYNINSIVVLKVRLRRQSQT